MLSFHIRLNWTADAPGEGYNFVLVAGYNTAEGVSEAAGKNTAVEVIEEVGDMDIVNRPPVGEKSPVGGSAAVWEQAVHNFDNTAFLLLMGCRKIDKNWAYHTSSFKFNAWGKSCR